MIGLEPPEPDSPEFVEADPTGRYGRYNEILGKGASKTVYRAFDEYEGIEVAWNQVKLYDFLRSPQDLERLYCEIHLLKTLKHKNIMKFYSSWVDTANRNINFVTEMFTSGTLRQYRQKHKKVSIRAVKHWCRQILRGLVYLHSHDPPVIHRDLKCDNIFVNGNQGEVKIGDLGLAAILRKSHAARCVGTPEFMAPEIYEEEYNELVDIYSFGMCLLEMVTFEYPYSECTHPAQIYKKVISGKRPGAFYRVKDPELRQFVEKCLATVSQRLPARELLKDPFLQIDDYSSDSRLIDCGEEIDEICPLLEQPLLDHYHNGDIPQNGYSNHLAHETENGWGYDVDGIEPHGIELFHDHEDEHSANVDIAIRGKKRDDDGIFLRLRIADSEGHVRNIYFPFDVETDTALSVATEMVAELDITDQDVTKIADMIDGEISSLVPEWKPGPGIEDTPAFSTTSFCHHCNSNCSSNGPHLNHHSSSNPDAKNLQVLQSYRIECAAMHGRFEEITYEVEGSEQMVDDPPVAPSQLDRLHYTDIWAQYEGPNSILGRPGQVYVDEKSENSLQPTSAKEETLNHKSKHMQSNAIKSVHELYGTSPDHQHLEVNPFMTVPSSTDAPLDDYENEIRQELRWLKARYQMELRELRNQQFGGSWKFSDQSPAASQRKERTKNGVTGSSAWTSLQGENNNLLLKSSALQKEHCSYLHIHGSMNSSAPKNSSPSFETQRAQHCEATQECSPDYIFTAKTFYTGTLLPQSLHRSKSLPVDAIDV